MSTQKGAVSFFIISIVIVTSLTVLGSYFYFLKDKSTLPDQLTSVLSNEERIASSPMPTPEKINLPAAAANTPIPLPKDKAWKTYTDSKLGISFRYPDIFTLEKFTASATMRESISLKKDTGYNTGGGMAGSDVLRKGAIISFALFPSKKLSEEKLKSEFGGQINKVTVDTKEGWQVIFPNGQTDTHVYFQEGQGALSINLLVGFDNTAAENQNYLLEFNNILSTVEFTQ